jgi:hypothetical protein
MISEHEYRIAAGGRGCLTKILHSRANLPQQTDDDSMAKWFSDDAGKLHALAALLFPDAVEVSLDDPAGATKKTHQLLETERPVSGARFENENVRCRVDFVTRSGDILRIYQVVPCCFDLGQHKKGIEFTYCKGGNVRAGWRDALELMSLRVSVIQSLWPKHRVIPFLILPVNGRTSGVQNLHGCFAWSGDRWIVKDFEDATKATNLLATVSVWEECTGLVAGVTRRARELDERLRKPIAPVVDYFCKKCSFNVAGVKSGYDLCWGALARATPHMFDLYYLWDIKEPTGRKNEKTPLATRLAREGRVLMTDIPRELIAGGEHSPRQLMQIEGTRLGREVFDPELKRKIESAVFPIFFLDFETISGLSPTFSNSSPGSTQIVQFSLHRRDHPDGDLVHQEYLHVGHEAPARPFLRALRSAVGDHGNVFTWTECERNNLFALQAALLAEGDNDRDDLEWLHKFLKSPRIVDQNQWTLFWFHPKMGGRTKLKTTLAAAWSVDSPVKLRHPYSAFPADRDPYSVLRQKGQVSEGGGAMIAYAAMQAAEGDAQESLVAELLEYCGVDTLAQAFLWDYWEWNLISHNSASNAGGVSRGTPNPT